MLGDDDDGACPSAEAAKNADNANTAEHIAEQPQIDERIGIAGLRFGTRNPAYVLAFSTLEPRSAERASTDILTPVFKETKRSAIVGCPRRLPDLFFSRTIVFVVCQSDEIGLRRTRERAGSQLPT